MVSALRQTTSRAASLPDRLTLARREPAVPAGAVAEALGVANSSISFHLAQLRRAGLIRQQRQSRLLIYSAEPAMTNALAGYLLENCCAGAQPAPSGRRRRRRAEHS